MNGADSVRFSDLFLDTVRAHGLAWAWKHYSRKGMTRREFRIWARSTLL